ncbi:glycoside hydrolase family 13 protein [Lacticaseibacillus brantae]|uniref:Amylopullulanase n=1 Tax=Lacticaseibacillus brantae DSM 23927 TaxID=1423727 RepID=A0A0R2AZ90_9LACO|nr:glycoside hydrolase family 13 protein [Lacticaseibacillus brantae]KRM72186.1 amylopullulanase [Lacticaseibacillus brantae DSM 23927]
MNYNSFTDRQPFGAVLVGTTITWNLKPSEEDAIWLLLYRDGYWDKPDRIAFVHQASGWQASATLPDAGLWYYGFESRRTDQTTWYGCVDGGFGGLGQNYADFNQLQRYQITVMAQTETIPDWWHNALVYHIFVDRFSNGNADGHVLAPKPNSFIYGQKTDRPYYIRDSQGEIVRWDFYGGNLLGIQQALPLLQARGVTVLYLSPIFEARSNHRYDTGDYEKIDAMLGDLDQFKAFVQAVHHAGMHLILDGVFNHVGADSRYFNAVGDYPNIGAANRRDSPYADWFTFKHFPDDYASWWGVRDLPAVNKENQDFHHFIAGSEGVVNDWTALGVDGWRLDVVDELADDFVSAIRQRLNQFPNRLLIGEVWEDASHKIAYGKRRTYFQDNQLQATMNYPLRQLLLDLIGQRLMPEAFIRQLMTLKENYPAVIFDHNFNLLDSHDTPRVLTTLNGNLQQLQAIITLLFTLPGNPVIYYGDEVGLVGGPDPDNRAFYPWGHENQAVLAMYQQAIQRRYTQPALDNAASWFPFSFVGGVGYLRSSEDQRLLIVVNTTPQAQHIVNPDLTLVPVHLRQYIPLNRGLEPWATLVAEIQ